MHRTERFSAILAFDLMGAGGLAWRIAREFGIPAAGWALGSDVRPDAGSPRGREVADTLRHLDLVLYQSHELRSAAAGLMGVPSASMPAEKHVVLPHGIPLPPPIDRDRFRAQTRKEWGVEDGDLAVVYTGRLIESKGVFELLSAFAEALRTNSRLISILLGSSPDFDETSAIRERLDAQPDLAARVRILPSVHPDRVWEQLCGADIFAFPSHGEGMPNSLLEAMAMGVPAISFAIPAVLDIDIGRGVLRLVPPRDAGRLAEAILELSASESERRRLGELGHAEVIERFSIRRNVVAAAERLSRLPLRSGIHKAD
jgi:glycosyltransferase involved in cell wall biosynthesis